MTDPMELVGRLEAYRPTNEWGDPVHHVIADEAAACIREMVEWRPIETAPRDGTEFQAWWKGAWHPRARFDPEYGSFQLWGRTDYDTEGWEVFEIDGLWQPQPLPPAPGAEA